MYRHTTSTVQELRACKLRVTQPRCAVLEWLIDNPHATAEQVHAGVTHWIGSISKQAVYDVLAVCVEASLVRQIKPSGHSARFERRAGDNHHHLVCRVCGRVRDTDCHEGKTPCLQPDPADGFIIDEAEIVFWGVCRDCQSQRAADIETEIEVVSRQAQ